MSTRLVADRALVARIRQTNGAGQAWEELATVLDTYARPILRAWIFSTRIFAECWRKGVHVDASLLRRVRPYDRPWCDHEADDLASETILRAFQGFRRQLLAGRWDPSMGASLTTFFIGQCLFHFPNVYQRWLRENQLVLVDVDDTTLALLAGPAADADPAEIVSQRDAAVRALAQLPDARTRQVLQLSAIGHGPTEIAHILGITPKAIAGVLYRYRRQLRSAVGQGDFS
jgi:DNA-directed RNA polymerase specialized sigma24 family protein